MSKNLQNEINNCIFQKSLDEKNMCRSLLNLKLQAADLKAKKWYL